MAYPANFITNSSSGGYSTVVTANFTRPSNTTAYASAQLVANSTTAGSVVPLSLALARTNGATALIRRIRLAKSGTSLTNASFRVHLYSASPTVSNGDGGTWLTNLVASYTGSFDVVLTRAFTDGAKGIGVPNEGSDVAFKAATTATTCYALIEARAAYTPVSAEIFTLTVEALQD